LLCREQLIDQNAAQKSDLFGLADGWAVMKSVVALRFDGVENSDAAAAEHFQVDAEFAFDSLRERKTFVEENTRTSDKIFHYCNIIRGKAAGDDIVIADAMLRGDIQWNVDAAFFEVARNVLPKIC